MVKIFFRTKNLALLLSILLIFNGIGPALAQVGQEGYRPSKNSNEVISGQSFGSQKQTQGNVQQGYIEAGGQTAVPFSGTALSIPGQSLSGALGLSSSYSVHVLGEVGSPGVYKIPPSTRVTEALQIAGGLTPKGSERFIKLNRPSEGKTYILDIYSYRKMGKISDNPFLLDNDALFVPLKKKVVQIEGSVKRPGDYEVKDEHSLYDVLAAVGGFTVGSSKLESIKVIRFDQYEQKHIWEVDKNLRELRSFVIQNGDVIVAPHLLTSEHSFDYDIKELPNDNLFYPSFENRVFMVGALHTPGPYNFSQYYNLRHYLSLAGGPRIDAKDYVTLVRRDGTKQKVKPSEYERIKINPGDTVLVPQKKFTEQYLIGLFTSIVSLGLTSYAILK